MKTITIREVRQRWPAAERLLQSEGEVMITRDGRPIARLIRLAEDRANRRRFSPTEHRRWQRQVFGPRTTLRWVDKALASSRSDRH